VQRISWDDLPAGLAEAIEARTGPILSAYTVVSGHNSPVAATVVTAEGKTFVKGLPNDNHGVKGQLREIAVAPLVSHISPRLLWHFDAAGWTVLGYEHIDGRHADYSPNSPDPDALMPVIEALGQIEVSEPSPLFKRAEDRWKSHVADAGELEAFRGSTLQHTDWIPQNVLIATARPYLVDWAWPTLGAAWMDPAYMVIRLMASGHSIKDAEAFASRIPAYAGADPTHLDSFAAANKRMWDEIERQAVGHTTTPWMRSVALAAREWADDRRNHTRVFAL
jgi:hypothetical protein